MLIKKIVRVTFATIVGIMVIIFVPSYKPTNAWAEALDPLLQNPRVRAFLDVIAYAEGTLHEQGYYTLYGGGIFDDYTDHPRRRISTWSQNKLLTSTAAGRYQILTRTFDHWSSLLNLSDFSPENQDKIALALIRQMGALKDILAGRFEVAIKKVSSIWASLPGARYNQPTMLMKNLKEVYKKRLIYHS